MPDAIRQLYNWFKKKKAHYLFPFLTFAIGWWLGMLTNPVIGAIFISITIYLVLVIFVPWDKIKIKWERIRGKWGKINGKQVIVTYIIPVIICVIVIAPLWNNIVGIFPSPYNELIRTATSTVDITVKSDENVSAHEMLWGGYLAFCKGEDALLLTTSTDYFIHQIGESRVVYHGVFNMDANSEATKNIVRYLEKTQYISLGFNHMNHATENMTIIDGKAVVTINNSVRLEFDIPPQEITRDFVVIQNIQEYIRNAMK
jgi:hypothetical protein